MPKGCGLVVGSWRTTSQPKGGFSTSWRSYAQLPAYKMYSFTLFIHCLSASFSTTKIVQRPKLIHHFSPLSTPPIRTTNNFLLKNTYYINAGAVYL